jgi:site-specific recombinase XerD
MSNSHLKLVVPTTEKRTVTPKRAKNSELRTREYLTEREVEQLMVAARQNRHGHRDATMILIAFRHGLRASELVDLVGIRSISVKQSCTSAGPREARPACIH